jgi:hypothetical protein
MHSYEPAGHKSVNVSRNGDKFGIFFLDKIHKKIIFRFGRGEGVLIALAKDG